MHLNLPHDPEPQPPPPSPATDTQPPTVYVLIADDERINRTTVAELLHPHYRVLLAKDGPSCLATARAQCAQLALVLLDVSMPGLNGYEVLHQLRADTRTAHIPVIFITGQSDEAAEEYGLSLGAADYVSKPVRPAVLLARVKNQVELFLQKRQLEQLALIDPLTGLANRRNFDNAMALSAHRCGRTAEYFGLAMVDIDHFKQFNDLYGHPQGDYALRAVAQLMLQHAQRSGELAARYGGEEFAFIHISTSPHLLPQRMETLRAAVQALRIPHADSPHGVLTVSIGTLVCGPCIQLPMPQYLEHADQQLYSAKKAGRNRINHLYLSN